MATPWSGFEADADAEAAIARALLESPVGKPPPAATLPLSSFLLGILLGALGIAALHFLVGVLRLSGPPRYALEAVLVIAVGVVVLRWWRRLAQEGRAVDDKGQPVSGDVLLSAYRQFVFGQTYRPFGAATAVEGDRPAAFAGGATVGRNADHLVLSTWDAEAGRLVRAGWPLQAVREVERVEGGARVVLEGAAVTLRGVDAEALRVLVGE